MDLARKTSLARNLSRPVVTGSLFDFDDKDILEDMYSEYDPHILYR